MNNTDTKQAEQLNETAVINSALIPMTDFVLREQKNIMWDSFNKVVRYANFLKQPLTLGMFIPCDEDGNILKEPKFVSPEGVKWEDYVKQFEQAKERVLFEGFEVTKEEGVFYIQKNDIELWYNKKADMWEHLGEDVYWDIESLSKYSENICTTIKLTDNAIKRIFC